MSRLRFRISISLDGFVAGPNQTREVPLGVGGEDLHNWVVPLEVWRRAQGMEGGEVNESTRILEEELVDIGATIMGRKMFGGGPGAWNSTNPWKGWWGKNPPYHHPVFILTNHARDPLVMEGGTTFNFVTDGIESALDQARRAANGKDIALAGGADAARQYLNAGLVDEMHLHLVPLLLGSGERLFENSNDMHGLELIDSVAAPGVIHLNFARS